MTSDTDVDELFSPTDSGSSSAFEVPADEENSEDDVDDLSDTREDHNEELPEVENNNPGPSEEQTIAPQANNSQRSSGVTSWNGVRLYPPSRTSSKPSKAWKFGGFRKNPRGELVTSVTVCGLCGKEINYKKHSNTSKSTSQYFSQE